MTLVKMRWYIVLICLIYKGHAHSTTTQLEVSSTSPSVAMDSHEVASKLLPANLPLFRGLKKHHPPSPAQKTVHAPAASPPYSDAPSDSSPTSSQLSKPSRNRNGLPIPTIGLTPPSLVDISPTHSIRSSDPSILAQPPLSANNSS